MEKGNFKFMGKCEFLVQTSRKVIDLSKELLTLESDLYKMPVNKRHYLNQHVIPSLKKDINFYLDMAIAEANRLLEERKYER